MSDRGQCRINWVTRYVYMCACVFVCAQPLDQWVQAEFYDITDDCMFCWLMWYLPVSVHLVLYPTKPSTGRTTHFCFLWALTVPALFSMWPLFCYRKSWVLDCLLSLLYSKPSFHANQTWLITLNSYYITHWLSETILGSRQRYLCP